MEIPHHPSSGIVSLLNIRCFHSYSSRDRDSMSWHGKSHLSSNWDTQQPSITVWTECRDPNWSLSGEFNVHPPSLSPSPPTLSLQYQSALQSLHLKLGLQRYSDSRLAFFTNTDWVEGAQEGILWLTERSNSILWLLIIMQYVPNKSWLT